MFLHLTLLSNQTIRQSANKTFFCKFSILGVVTSMVLIPIPQNWSNSICVIGVAT